MLPEEEVGAQGGEEDDQDGRLPEHVEVEAEDEVGAETKQDREQHELRQEEHLHCSPTETLHPQTENPTFKGIDRSFELRCEIKLNRFVMTNWRLGNFFYFILKGQHHKISKKPKDAA